MINLKIQSIAKDRINQILIENDFAGQDKIISILNKLFYSLNNFDCEDQKLKSRIIKLIIQDTKQNVQNTILLNVLKSHLVNLIDTIGKIYLRKIDPKFVIYNTNNLKRINSKLYQTKKSATKAKDKLELITREKYSITTLNHYKNLKTNH